MVKTFAPILFDGYEMLNVLHNPLAEINALSRKYLQEPSIEIHPPKHYVLSWRKYGWNKTLKALLFVLCTLCLPTLNWNLNSSMLNTAFLDFSLIFLRHSINFSICSICVLNDSGGFDRSRPLLIKYKLFCNNLPSFSS